MALPPVVGLEVGTSKTVALVGEWREDNHVNIVGIGKQGSAGIRKGEIVDFEKAFSGVQSALNTAEERSGVSIGEVLLAVSGAHLDVDVNRGMTPVLSRSREITRDDVEQVMEVAEAVNLGSDREIVHTINQHFFIDDTERVLNPEGLQGAKLSLDMLVIHGHRNPIANLVSVVEKREVDIQDVVFSGLCSALSVLAPEEKKRGVVLIDIGGGTTDYVVYSEGLVRSVGVFGLGGDHITNDVSLAFNIPTSQAEKTKCDFGSAVERASDEGEMVSLPAEVNFSGSEFSLHALNQVIHARTDEILRKVRVVLEREGSLQQFGAGVVLTGGSAHLDAISTIGENVFGMPCRIGSPRNFVGLSLATAGPEYATACGLIQYGFKLAQETGKSGRLTNWFANLFGKSG